MTAPGDARRHRAETRMALALQRTGASRVLTEWVGSAWSVVVVHPQINPIQTSHVDQYQALRQALSVLVAQLAQLPGQQLARQPRER